jgi:hypothetical protein
LAQAARWLWMLRWLCWSEASLRQSTAGGRVTLLEKDQKGDMVQGAKMLSTDVLTEKNRRHTVTGSWGQSQITQFYKTPYLAVLNHGNPLAKIYMKRARKTGHKGICNILHRSRQHLWVNGKSWQNPSGQVARNVDAGRRSVWSRKWGNSRITGQTQAPCSSQ